MQAARPVPHGDGADLWAEFGKPPPAATVASSTIGTVAIF